MSDPLKLNKLKIPHYLMYRTWPTQYQRNGGNGVAYSTENVYTFY